MLQILNDSNQALELYPDTSIPVERNNPLFSKGDQYLQDILYPGKAPLSPANKLFIKSGHLVESGMEVYEMSCRVIDTGLPFYTGVFTYKIINDQIEFTIKVNFGAIAKLVKSTLLNQIYTLDAPTRFTLKHELEDFMKSTCENPENHPMVYFPVFNPKWSSGTLKLPLINNWDISLGRFDTYTNPYNNTIEVPFYKLSYIFRKIFQALGFNTEGGYYEEEVSRNIHLFTRAGSQSLDSLSPLSYYLPEITITEFLKKITDRLKYTFEFDLLKRSVYIETPQSILKSKFYNDITEYVTAIKEISVSEKKGYRVTLKVDETDPAMNSGSPEDPVFLPLYELIVGDGGNSVELDVSTLKSGEGESGYVYPINGQEFTTPFIAVDLTTWQLKLLKYNGMKSLPDGKFWPEAIPVELDDSDALWYRFLNDSKTIKIEAALPITMVSTMKATQKIRFKTKEGNIMYALPEKISYHLFNKTSNRIMVSIIARTISSSLKTTAVISKIDDPLVTFGTIKYKAYFNPEIHGINEVKAVRVAVIGSGTFESTPVTVPTDKNGMGGDVGLLLRADANTDPVWNSELRVYNLSPQYLVFGGRKHEFLTASDYKYVPLDQTVFTDNTPVWIVF